TMIRDTYQVLGGQARYESKIKGSRFIASGNEIVDSEAAEHILKTLHRKFHDATHNCYAYRLGYGSQDTIITHQSDDGEPTGTAGAPILQALAGAGLTNSIIVVTRYFGGTKLGTGGLARAYSEAAHKLIAEAGTAQRILYAQLTVTYSFDLTSPVMHCLTTHGARIINTTYTDQPIISAEIRLRNKQALMEDLIGRTNGQAVICET
ncbi:MAG: hypothetical protein GY868_02995, partial [Deltaproteobacteria bacterium]|nr:hypothetical protein [Deltaproteobacteria bacterium]